MMLSILLPTYNNEKTLKDCLDSVFMQKFREMEVLILDGGSTDRTLEIAKAYPVKIINNPKRNEEAARIIGLKKAKGKILCFIDADNVLVGDDWLKRMLRPFEDNEIIFSETLYFSYRKKDPIKVKYQALIGGDDPLVSLLGFYSRWCYFKNNWSDYPYSSEKKGDYYKIRFKEKSLVPAMGSNGFLIRREILKKFVRDSFIHSDIVYQLVNSGYNCFAKVNIGIIHNQPTFFKNKVRRIKRRINKEVEIKYNYGFTKLKVIEAFFHIILIFPLFIDVMIGFKNKPTLAWLFHFPACFGLLSMHVYYRILSGNLRI